MKKVECINATMPDQNGCGYCQFEQSCPLHKIWAENKPVFRNCGITTHEIAKICKLYEPIIQKS